MNIVVSNPKAFLKISANSPIVILKLHLDKRHPVVGSDFKQLKLIRLETVSTEGSAHNVLSICGQNSQHNADSGWQRMGNNRSNVSHLEEAITA